MSTETFDRIATIREFLRAAGAGGRSIGLVPTMGALHDGHGTLIEKARKECDVVVVSIYVNPTQFGPDEDHERYPRQAADDEVYCEVRGVDAIFAPSDDQMYPEPLETSVRPGIEARRLCGPFRPGHFEAVLTVVLKLFAITGPDRAYFGDKDFQQRILVARMVRDLDLPVEIVSCPIARESDGLAISSRNRYLKPEEREVASVLNRALRVARQRMADGESDPAVAIEAARTVIDLVPQARIEYLEVVDPERLQPVGTVSGPVRIAGAIWIGETRLIDNLECDSKRKRRRKKKAEG